MVRSGCRDMKRIAPNWLSRLKRAWRPAGKILLVSSGFVGAILGIASRFVGVLPPVLIPVAIVGCVVPALGVLAWKSRSHHLPDVVFASDNPDGLYALRYCPAADLKEANSWTRLHYGHEYVSDEVAESWRRKAPKSFVGLFDSGGLLCAAFGVIAVESSFMKQFIKGRLKDNILTSDDICDDDEARKSPDLYISGVVVRDPDSYAGNKRACTMFWGMAKFIEHRYGVRRRRALYALAVSSPSRSWLRRAGFARHNGPDDRLDHLELYSLELTRQQLDSIFYEIGDYSGLCKMELDR